jgi:hypothetical protein
LLAEHAIVPLIDLYCTYIYFGLNTVLGVI